MEKQNPEGIYQAVCNVVREVVENKAVRATKYLLPNKIVRATRVRYKRMDSRDNIELTVTIGRPNYLEREFVELCKKAGEPFPVKKIQLKLPPNGRLATKQLRPRSKKK